MEQEAGRSAVIYCRVSAAKQKKLGDGLHSQQTRCREYAKYRGHTVRGVFEDDVSGGLSNRPGMAAMLTYLHQHSRDPHVVIIDDISRLARGVKAHIELRAAIALAGGVLESPSVEFGEDADSELQEFILATVAQHQRRKNAEQVKNRMRARMMNGYSVFCAPVGYRYQRIIGHNKMLVRDEPQASIIQEALEGYAVGRFQTQVEVQRFLESKPEFKYNRSGRVHQQRVADLLGQVLYAGHLDPPADWNVPLCKGNHEALISFEAFQRIQTRLTEIPRAPVRKDISADFPLRGAVVCASCDQALTACWSTGRTTTYPYYLCKTPGCIDCRKSIRRERIEGEFEALLRRLQPTPALFRAARAMFEELWQRRLKTADATVRAQQKQVEKIAGQIEQMLDRIADASVPSVIGAYENRIRKLEEERLLVSERIATAGRPRRSLDATLRTAFDFLENPWKLWVSEDLAHRRAVLKLAFAGRLTYARGSGFRTANLSLPFKMLSTIQTGKKMKWWSRAESNCVVCWQVKLEPENAFRARYPVRYPIKVSP